MVDSFDRYSRTRGRHDTRLRMDILENRQGLFWDEVLEGAVESLRKTKGLLARSVNWERMQFVGLANLATR